MLEVKILENENINEINEQENNNNNNNNSENEEITPEVVADENAEKIKQLEHELAVSRADFYNFRQRALKEKQDTRRNAQEDVILNFLPVLDNLDRALSANKEKIDVMSDDTKNILTGVEMVQRQFINALENFGVKIIPALGEKFDPALHEAAGTEEISNPEQDGLITNELLKGYKTEKRVLRPSRVLVGKA